MINREINGVTIAVDQHSAGDLYFSKEFANTLPSSGITDILISIYKNSGNYTPESMMLELTSNCNFNCPFCYIHTCKKLDKEFRSSSQIISTLDFFIKKGMLSISITGGECLSHPQFVEIYKYLKQNGVIVTVLSNLSLLNETILNVFKEYPPYKIDVSIYAITDDQMKKVTGAPFGTAKKVLDNILLLKQTGINVTAKTPHNKLTDSEIINIEKWCHENSIPYFSDYEIVENYDHTSMNKYSMGEKTIAMDRKDAYLKKYSDNAYEFNKKIMFNCKGGEYGIFLSHDFKIRPCMPFYDIEEANFDITKTEELPNIFEKYKSFIYKYKGQPLPGCAGCNVSSFCQECIIGYLRRSNNNDINYICKKNKEYYS